MHIVHGILNTLSILNHIATHIIIIHVYLSTLYVLVCVQSLASYDLVITTYNIVGIEGESCQDEDTVNQRGMIRCRIPVEWLFFSCATQTCAHTCVWFRLTRVPRLN